MADLGQLEAEKNSEEKVYKFPNFIIFLFFCAGVFVIGGIILTIIIFFDPIYGESNIIGETIGGTVGPVWALAGVTLFVSALLLQIKELRLQRESFNQSVVAQKESAKALQTQALQNIIRAEIDVKIALLGAIIALVEIGGDRRGALNQAQKYKYELESLLKELKR